MTDLGEPLTTNDAVMAYRLSQMEASVRELRGEFKESFGTLGGGLTALQTQLSSYQTTQADRFITRREAEDRFGTHQERLDALSDQAGQRGWLLAMALVSALISAVFSAIGWLHPFGH